MDALKQFIQKNGVVAYIILIVSGMFIVNLILLAVLGKVGFANYLSYLALPTSFSHFIRQPWSLVTWWAQVPPMRIISLLFDLMFIWSFSGIYRMFLGEKRLRNWLIFVTFMGGIGALIVGGGAWQGISGNTDLPRYMIPQLFGLDVMLVGLVAAVIAYKPNMPVNLFIFGEVKIIWFGVILILFSFVSYFGNFFAGFPGLVTALGLGIWQGISLRSGGGDRAQWVGNLIDPKSRPKPKPVPKSPKPTKLEVVKSPTSPDEDEINRILDKINNVGYEGLTRQEKETLARYSEQK